MDKLEFLKERLENYLAAERAILSGQEYTIGDRHLRRPDLKYIQQQIQSLLEEINLLTLNPGRIKRVILID